ncbi:hypothetical protein Z947_1659 [Sulfitobacter geojensis]|nr:hypothetical protein Z947_1659 [Sulfitobacter geojensis]
MPRLCPCRALEIAENTDLLRLTQQGAERCTNFYFPSGF